MARPRGDERPSRTFKESPEFLLSRGRLGARVRALRHERALTLEAAAERMQLDLKHLQKVEAGQGNVTLVTLVRIAMGLEVELPDLVPATGEDPAALPPARGYGTTPAPIAAAADADDVDAPDAPSGEGRDRAPLSRRRRAPRGRGRRGRRAY
jgi:transcriptional regulator with XRE-family HTH domain